MMFVDGENFAIRAKEAADAVGFNLTPGDRYRPDVFYWREDTTARRLRVNIGIDEMPLEGHAVRAFYYTTVPGGSEAVTETIDALWRLGFTPRVFHKSRDKRTKGVDITLAIDMLANAIDNNYDAAVLVAGDADYVPLVEEVKRRGKMVVLWFFERSGLSPELRRAADVFEAYEEYFR